jgi:hypothetical protein
MLGNSIVTIVTNLSQQSEYKVGVRWSPARKGGARKQRNIYSWKLLPSDVKVR